MHVVTSSLGANVDEVVLAAPRLLGFKATSAQLKQLFKDAIENMRSGGKLVQHGSLLVPGIADHVEAPSTNLPEHDDQSTGFVHPGMTPVR